MLDNVAINVVIGLVFIYLLYSLFATIVSEIIATKLGLRARNLKEAVDRMLNDEQEDQNGFLARLLDSLKLTKNPDNPRITNFYNHPEIKYLGSTGIFKIPSQFKAVSFSKTLLNLLNETGYKKLNADSTTRMENPEEGDIKKLPVDDLNKENINAALNGIIEEHKATSGYEKAKIVLDHETAKYVLNLWKDSYGDIVKFKLQLEAWFDRTMEQCLEWYKRKIRMVLLVLGFMMAWFFNADTFTIIHKLSTDKDAREKLVSMATAYVANNKAVKIDSVQNDSAVTSTQIKQYNQKLDSLLEVKKKLDVDIQEANTLLGLGGWLPDSIEFKIDSVKGRVPLSGTFEKSILPQGTVKPNQKNYIHFSLYEKLCYLFSLLSLHFWGFLITAIAISLGAPFWFDLLNKLMRLRTSVKQDTDSTNTNANGTVSPLNREA